MQFRSKNRSSIINLAYLVKFLQEIVHILGNHRLIMIEIDNWGSVREANFKKKIRLD